jgi:type VI secretion system protein ImpF
VSTVTWASHTPLFDRLCAPAPTSASARLLQGAELRASIARDLERLLNTRNGLTVGESFGREATVLTFGLPDTLALDTQADGGLKVLAQVVQRAITQFEPRLREVSVQAQPGESCTDRAQLVITAAVTLGRQMQRVDFELVIDAAGMPLSPVA